MYYQSYEDYMRMVLGYPPVGKSPYETSYETPFTRDAYGTSNYILEERDYTISSNKMEEYQELYPEIYRALTPAISNCCAKYGNEPMTKELITKMTEEVYNQIDFSNEIMIKINLEGDRSSNTTDNQKSEALRTTTTSKMSDAKKEVENRSPRRPNNPLLRDLIRILILNQLLNQRPPRPRPPHGRPPMGGRPPFGPVRPQPREFTGTDYLAF